MHVFSAKNVLKRSEDYPYKNRFGVSKAFVKELRDKHGYTKNVAILPNSIDLSIINKNFNNKYEKNTEKYIFCNARLSPEKGVIYALEGFAPFVKKYPEFKLYLCDGDFPFGDKNIVKEEIIKRAKDLHVLQNIKFIPKLNWDIVPSVIRNSYCTILPSLTESFGLAILESLALGKPTITTKVGNLPALVEDAGILVDCKNSEQIFKALDKIYNNKAVYNELAQKAKKRAHFFDNKYIAKNFLKEINM